MMTVNALALLSLLTEMLWPLVTFGIAFLACNAFCRWLQREQGSVRAMQLELRSTQNEWTARFEAIERSLDQRMTLLEKRVTAMQPGMNPLGSHYSTRNAG